MYNNDAALIDEVLLTSIKEKADKEGIDLELGAVFYTDGSGDTKLGVAGFGLHGLVYANVPSKTGNGIPGYSISDYGYILDEKLHQEIRIRFDLAGEKTYTRDIDVESTQPICYLKGKGALEVGTNNTGEAMAFYRAVELADRLYRHHGIRKFHFVLDAKYVLDTVERLPMLRENGWKKSNGEVIANLELWQSMDQLLLRFYQPEITVTFEWAEGHTDNFGNIQADIMAGQAIVAARNEAYYETLDISPAKGYWTKKPADIHPFLIDTYWYCKPTYPDQPHPTLGLYPMYVGQHDLKRKVMGLPSQSDIHGIVYLSEIPETLLAVKQYCLKMESGKPGFVFDGIWYAEINTIMNRSLQGTLLEGDGALIRYNPMNMSLSSFNKRPLVSKFTEQRLSKTTIEEQYGEVDLLLHRFKSDKLYPWENATDVTHHFYAEETGKAKGFKFHVESNSHVTVDHHVKKIISDNVYHDVAAKTTLSFGLTCPVKRVFSSIKQSNPKLTLLTRCEHGSLFYFYLVIETKNGEIGLWTNFSSNKQVVQLKSTE